MLAKVVLEVPSLQIPLNYVLWSSRRPEKKPIYILSIGNVIKSMEQSTHLHNFPTSFFWFSRWAGVIS